METAHKSNNVNGTQQNGHSNLETKINVYDKTLLTGFALWKNQFLAMLMKRALSTWRSMILFFVQNLIPVAFLVIAIVVTRTMDATVDLPNLNMTLDSYNDPISVVTTNDINNPHYLQYKQMFESEHRTLRNWETGNMTQHMLEQVTTVDLITLKVLQLLHFRLSRIPFGSG